MAIYNKVAGAIALLESTVNSATDQWGVALAITAPTNTTFIAGTTDLVTGSGYTQGGANVTTTSSSETAGVYKLALTSPPTWTATGAGFSFQYVILVDKTLNASIGYWDYSSIVALNGGNADTFTASLDLINGVFQVA
jgi:hypothetical protein